MAWNPSLLFFRSNTLQILAWKPARSLLHYLHTQSKKRHPSRLILFVFWQSYLGQVSLKLPIQPKITVNSWSLLTKLWDYRCVSPHWLGLLSFLLLWWSILISYLREKEFLLVHNSMLQPLILGNSLTAGICTSVVGSREKWTNAYCLLVCSLLAFPLLYGLGPPA